MSSKISFETNIENAKKLLNELMKPEIPLQESMKLYKDGIQELELATKILESAKLEYEVLKNG